MNLPNVSSVKLGTHINTGKISVFAVPIGSILVSLLVFVLIVWPKLSNTLSLRTENKELKQRVEQLNDKVSVLSSFDKIELQQDLGSAEALLPSDKGIFSLLRQVELSAASTGVVLTKVDVAPGSISGTGDSGTSGQSSQQTASQTASEPSDVAKILIKVTLNGDYSSFLNFLTNIANSSRITSIDDLTLSTSSSSSSSGEVSPLRSSMVINGYWKPRPTKLGQIESPVTPLTEEESLILKKVMTFINNTPSDSAAVPSVPIGRSDLFAPF